jgi:hypothetical protein
MLEKPDLQDERIFACLQDEYGLLVVQVAFLPLGADRDTAVYRAANFLPNGVLEIACKSDQTRREE